MCPHGSRSVSVVSNAICYSTSLETFYLVTSRLFGRDTSDWCLKMGGDVAAPQLVIIKKLILPTYRKSGTFSPG